MKAKVLLGAGCVLTVMAAVACATKGGDDEASSQAIIGGSEARAYEEAALVDIERGGVVSGACSGAVIAPRVVLTAGHCIVGGSGWIVTTPYSARQKVRSVSALTFDYNDNGGTVNPNQHDVGLVVLPTPIRLGTYPTIARAPLAANASLINVGRIDNGRLSSTSLYASAPLRVVPGDGYGYRFAYVATEVIQPGDSGGPDFLNAPGRHVVVAVNSGAGGGTEVLARVDLVASWIDSVVDKNGGYDTGDAGTSDGGAEGGSDAGTSDGGSPAEGGADAGTSDGAAKPDSSAPPTADAGTTEGEDAGEPPTGTTPPKPGRDASTPSTEDEEEEADGARPRWGSTVTSSGCSASPGKSAGAAVALLALIPWLVLRRRSRRG